MNSMNPMNSMPMMNSMPPGNPPPGHGGPGPDPFFTSPFSPFYRRPAPSFMGQQQPDYRIHELNKRLQQRNEVSSRCSAGLISVCAYARARACVCEGERECVCVKERVCV